MSDIQRDLQIYRDNVQITNKKITDLQQKLMQITHEPGMKLSRLTQEVEKARNLTEKYQNEFSKSQSAFEKAQKIYTDAQDKVTRARELHLQIETRFQAEQNKTDKEKERERTKLNDEIRNEQQKQRGWASKADDAERKYSKELSESRQVATDNHSSTTGRQSGTLR